MAEETTENTEAQAKPEGEAKGGPDWQRAAQDYKAQRDAARQQADDLTAQLDKLKQSVEGMRTAEDVQKAVDDALAKAQADFDASKAQWADREKALTVQSALAEGGCIDASALLSHVDLGEVTVKDGRADGLDLGKLKESYPYLFGRRAQAGATDARPEGVADGGLDAKLDKAFGVKGE